MENIEDYALNNIKLFKKQDQDKINKVLQNNVNNREKIFSVYGEIITGLCIGRLFGYDSIEYDKKMSDDKHPDWFIKTQNVSLIIEVKSLLAKNPWIRFLEFRNKMGKIFQTINKNAIIKYDICGNSNIYKIQYPNINDEGHFKSEISTLIDSFSGDIISKEINGLEISIIKRPVDIDHIILMPPTLTMWGYHKGIEDDINKKVNRYKSLTSNNQFLGLCIVNFTIFSNVKYDSILDIVFGSEQFLLESDDNFKCIGRILNHKIINNQEYLNFIIYIEIQSDLIKAKFINLNSNSCHTMSEEIEEKLKTIEFIELK